MKLALQAKPLPQWSRPSCRTRAGIQARRFPVLKHRKRPAGIPSLDDNATVEEGNGTAEALHGISRHISRLISPLGERHNQTDGSAWLGTQRRF